VVFATVLAAVALAEVRALDPLLEALTVFLATPGLAAVASLKVPLGVCSLRVLFLFQVLEDLLTLG
jgi:hypothetical protein